MNIYSNVAPNVQRSGAANRRKARETMKNAMVPFLSVLILWPLSL